MQSQYTKQGAMEPIDERTDPTSLLMEAIRRAPSPLVLGKAERSEPTPTPSPTSLGDGQSPIARPLSDDDLNKIADVAADHVYGHIYDDWEGQGCVMFDPFDDYREEVIAALRKVFNGQ